MRLYETTYMYLIKEQFIFKLEETQKLVVFFFCDAASAGFVEMSNLFWSSLLECHIFTTGVIMQHSISLNASLG